LPGSADIKTIGDLCSSADGKKCSNFAIWRKSLQESEQKFWKKRPALCMDVDRILKNRMNNGSIFCNRGCCNVTFKIRQEIGSYRFAPQALLDNLATEVFSTKASSHDAEAIGRVRQSND
jgi:hypothetical protein